MVGFPLRIVGGIGWKGLEDRAIGEIEAAAPPEEPRPWWKGKKPRPEIEIDQVKPPCDRRCHHRVTTT